MYIARDASGNLHRETGPSVVLPHTKMWVMHGKLHRPDGPAVMTAFGNQFWWRGVSIPETMWYKSESMNLSDVMAISNVELRRSVLEKVGYEKILTQSKDVKIIHEDPKTGAKLYFLEMPEDDQDEPLVVVRLIDATPHENEKGELVSKVYYLRVPPDSKTCKDAIAWTFNMSPEQYAQLELET